MREAETEKPSWIRITLRPVIQLSVSIEIDLTPIVMLINQWIIADRSKFGVYVSGTRPECTDVRLVPVQRAAAAYVDKGFR